MPSIIKKALTCKNSAKNLVKKHDQLIHSENMKVTSHVQRECEDWIINTIMLDNLDVPFKYKRKKLYRSLQGQRVNLTYYLENEMIAGFSIEVMSVVRIKIS
ncbi:hypothetical protein [Colwellia psychrerythraea]|uniref:Uncharacterized protein n=1 Tax=Colwellia psychrerythraea TaxID=28229 RepID=A0A099L0G0_COLPS|nr:hypothetical protein [Colwellia psychrerythraea]KGJ96361.1 hypothetical protein GAB14E_0308 [Colwellia psychrerythraea]